MRDFALLLIAFLSGAILMALEILGSRVMAPYFGSSIYVWGSLIGVFLGALSLGYYLGGRLVDRWPHPGVLGAILTAAGVCVLLLPSYSVPVNDWLSLRFEDQRPGSLLACVLNFFVPGVLMGTTSPFVIRLTARSVERVGQTAGAVYAISTVGSIVGTIGTSFFLLSYLGAEANLRVLGGALVLTGLIAAALRRPARVAATVGLVLALGMSLQTARAERTLLTRDSAYHRLFVTEDEKYRYLRADNLYHSVMLLKDPHGRGLPYADYADIAFLYKPDLRSVLVIGLGGGTVPKRFVRDYPNVSVDAVEIDGDVVKIAGKYFDVHAGPRLKLYTSDGRQFLRRSKKKYDLIVLDAYYSDSVPFFLTTREFFKIVRDHLTPGGVFMNNTIGQASGPRSKFVRSVFRTTKETFPQAYVYKVQESDVRSYNFEVFAINGTAPLPITTIRQRAAQAQGKTIKDPELTKRLRNFIDPPLRTNDVPTLTDDYAPVDALLHLW